MKCDVGCIDREEGPDVFGFRRAFLVITLSLVHAVQDAIRLSNEDEWIHYFMLSMYSMMLSYTHRMSGVVYGNLDFDHKDRDDLKCATSEVADYYGLDLPSVTRAFL